VKRSSFNEFHHEEWHRAADHAKVSNSNDVLVANGGGGECFLSKARRQHRIVSDEVGKNDFYCVRGFEEDVARLKDDAHAALPETAFEQVAGI
jgi:hypothetical protein